MEGGRQTAARPYRSAHHTLSSPLRGAGARPARTRGWSGRSEDTCASRGRRSRAEAAEDAAAGCWRRRSRRGRCDARSALVVLPAQLLERLVCMCCVESGIDVAVHEVLKLRSADAPATHWRTRPSQ